MTNAPARPTRLRTGKLDAQRLEKLLADLPQSDPSVVVGPRMGEDAAAIEVGDRCVVTASDPVTFANDRVGWYAVQVNANDVAVLGARPRWFLAVLLLPEGASSELVESIMTDIRQACAALDVTVCGGHTEVTPHVDAPVVVGHMLGDVDPTRLIRKTNLQAGDDLLLTRAVAIEGTAILARERRATLAAALTSAVIDRAAALLTDPGISVVDAALTAVAAGPIHAMHDPTEGGILNGLAELATAASTGLVVDVSRIPVLPETRLICDHLNLDPLRLIASGALLIGVPPVATTDVVAALTAQAIPVTRIGSVRPADEGTTLVSPDGRAPFEPSATDELARLYEREAQDARRET
jgi:hydrogenase maturation factor